MERTKLEPLVKVVTVPLGREQAFTRFTEGISTWWPMHRHSVFQEETAEVVLEEKTGGRLYEKHNDGRESDWGEILEYDSPNKVRFTWHPGRGADQSNEVEVEFAEVEGGTQVTLTHRGWEIHGDQAVEQRGGYDKGWDFVLGRYVEL